MGRVRQRTPAPDMAELLLDWYGRNRRDLPWRESSDPYRIWISEIMLQQTQVDTAIPFYRRFMKRFPDVETLARAPMQSVLKAWENMGYYARARHLHEAAKTIMTRFGGRIPATSDALLSLPGVGSYTAGAVLSMAFGQQVPAVDGNVRRVLCRVFSIRTLLEHNRTKRRLQKLAETLVPCESPGSFNQALMELGALVCRPRNPVCTLCPIRDLCEAFAQGLQHRLPVSRKRRAVPHENVMAGVIRDHRGRILIVQRPEGGLLGLLWKFPGGLLKTGETLKNGLKRAVSDEVGIQVQSGGLITSVEHAYTHLRITLYAFNCTHFDGKPKALACRDWHWATPLDFKALPFSKVDRAVMASIQAH